MHPLCPSTGPHARALLLNNPAWGPAVLMPFMGLKIGGSFFYLQLELLCLQLSFFANSPLRPLLDALSHCKQKAPTVSKITKSVSKKAPIVSKKAKMATASKKAPL